MTGLKRKSDWMKNTPIGLSYSLYLSFRILKMIVKSVWTVIFIAIAMWLLIWPPENFEENVEVTKTTLIAILFITLGIRKRE